MRKLALCLVILLSVAIAADRGLAGKYAGDWKSNSGDGGAIRFTLDGPHGEAWKCDLMFVLSGTDVKTTMREVKVQETKIDLLYDFDAAGNTLRSHVTDRKSTRLTSSHI